MVIHKLGYHFQHKNGFTLHRPNGSGDWVLLIIPTAAYFVLNGKTVHTKPNCIILYQKGTPQHYGADGTVFVNHWIHFDLTDDEQDALRAMQIPLDEPFPCGDTAVFAQIIKNMYTEQYSINRHKEQSLQLYFQLLQLKISECLQSTSPPRSFPYYEKMSQIRSMIYQNPMNEQSIEALSREIMVSKSYFQHLYKQIFDVSVMQDVIAARIEHSQYLLANTDDSVSELAIRCGYRSDVHFMRQFKSIVGMTPTQYRKQIRLSQEAPQRSCLPSDSILSSQH